MQGGHDVHLAQLYVVLTLFSNYWDMWHSVPHRKQGFITQFDAKKRVDIVSTLS